MVGQTEDPVSRKARIRSQRKSKGMFSQRRRGRRECRTAIQEQRTFSRKARKGRKGNLRPCSRRDAEKSKVLRSFLSFLRKPGLSLRGASFATKQSRSVSLRLGGIARERIADVSRLAVLCVLCELCEKPQSLLTLPLSASSLAEPALERFYRGREATF